MASENNINNCTTTNNINDEQLEGIAEILNHSFAYVESLAIRSVIELHILDIIHSHGHPMSLPEIASKIDSTSLNLKLLACLMQFLARKKIFAVDYNQQDQQPSYALTNIAKWLLQDYELSLVPVFLRNTRPDFMAFWFDMARSIKEGDVSFEKLNGETVWEKISKEPEFKDRFYVEMSAFTRVTVRAIMDGYKEGFSKLEGTLVDVGGGNGTLVGEIVKAHPHIKGINFDMPHVVANAPTYPGVTHVGGDMFEGIPKGDTLLLKSVLHNWGDVDCIKILKQCRKAISEKNGKVIIVDNILELEGNKVTDDIKYKLDLLMMLLFSDAKERTQNELTKLCSKAGFTRYNIISIPAIDSIFEAFP